MTSTPNHFPLRVLSFISHIFLMACLFMPAQSSYALNQDWRSEPYRHVSINQDIIQLLNSFASEKGFSIIISEPIKTRENQKVNGSFNQTSEKFLNDICDLYNLIWFFDGQTLYIYGSEEQVSKILTSDAKQADMTKNALMKLGIWDDRFGWIVLPEEHLLHIHGPPAYISVIEHLHSTLTEVKQTAMTTLQGQEEAYVIQVFPLTYAWAENQYYDDGKKETKVEGVASKLRKMFHIASQDGEAYPHTRPMPEVPKSQQSLLPEGRTAPNDYTVMAAAMAQAGSSKAYIQADELTNSVIIYDKISLIGMYEKIIQSMDVSVAQVQIEVSIIEINTDRLGEFGIDWRLNGNDGSLGVNNVSGMLADQSGANLVFRKPGDFSTIFTGDATNLITRVHALSSEGEGQVMSQPAVLTMNNSPALIDNSQTFFVQLEGVEQVDLRDIKVGSLLKVTPRIINEAGSRRVQLKTIIEDGQITDKIVDSLPVIQKSVINTNTVIGENNSLLIGGYFFDNIQIRESKVPVLGSIPVLELLFKKKVSKRSKVARMFLITPKIVDNLADENYKYRAAKEIIDNNKDFKTVKPVSPSYQIFD